MDIQELIARAHGTAKAKGWWDSPNPFPQQLANYHGEISEAWEDFRAGRGLDEIYYEGEKPCGIPIELADTMIRIFDTCGHYGIDLQKAIEQKMNYNESRPYRHGNKRA